MILTILKGILAFAVVRAFWGGLSMLGVDPTRFIPLIYENENYREAFIWFLSALILEVLFFSDRWLHIFSSKRKISSSKGTEMIFQDDEELIFTEIATRWSDSSNPKDGFSYEQVMTILTKAIWLGKLKEELTWNYERAQTAPIYRPEDFLAMNRASLAFVLAHYWDESLRFLIDPERKCLLISNYSGDEPVSQFHAEIDKQYERMGTWKRLASLKYEQFENESPNVFQSVYIDPICVKKNVFLKWLGKSNVRLPENW